MLKSLIQVFPVLPAKDENERARLRPLGRNKAVYQSTLRGWLDLIRAADETGFWGATAIEHHFWSEGYEVGPCPAILNAYWAAITKNLHVGQLGYVLGTHNPIRVAEEIAVLDHLSEGRCFVGLARGFQQRWTGTLGQHLGATTTSSPSAAANSSTGPGFTSPQTSNKEIEKDRRNREMFEEHVEILLKAWKMESFRHKGLNWEIPFPYETGVEDWPLAHAGITQKYGAPNEVGANNNIQEVSVTPAPYTSPHPRVFVSGSGSPESIDYCAKQGFIPGLFTPVATTEKLSHQYRKTAAAHGMHRRLGENMCVVRWLHIAPTDAKALRSLEQGDAELWKNFYNPMGRRSQIDLSDATKSALASGLYSVGSVDTVRRDLVEQWKRAPCEYIILNFHFAMTPKEVCLQTMDLFMRHVQPALEEVMEQHRKSSADDRVDS